MQAIKKVLSVILCVAITVMLLPTYPVAAYGEEDVVSLGEGNLTAPEEDPAIQDKGQPRPDEDAVMYDPELEGLRGVTQTPDADALLTAQSSEQLAFPDKPYRNCIWPVEQDMSICYLTDKGNDYLSLRKYDITTGEVTTFGDYKSLTSFQYFVKDNVFYYTEIEYVHSKPRLHVKYVDLTSNETGLQFTINPFDHAVLALGIDQSNRFYIDGFFRFTFTVPMAMNYILARAYARVNFSASTRRTGTFTSKAPRTGTILATTTTCHVSR